MQGYDTNYINIDDETGN